MLIEKLKTEVTLESPEVLENVEEALERLVAAQWLEETDDRYFMPNEKRLILEGYERRFADMISVFKQQAMMDMAEEKPIPEELGEILTETAIDALIDIFEIRGREIVSMAFGASSGQESGLLDLIETIWRRVNRLEDSLLKLTLVRFLLDLLSNPTGIYETVLNYMARAFFCIQALRMDSNVKKIVSNLVSERSLIVDANVLIPLTASCEERFEFVKKVIEVVQNAGIPLYTTLGFIDEVNRHANWALQLVDEFGTQSVEVLQASKGKGNYDPNAYLQGFINWNSRRERGGDFREYLGHCFGGSYSQSRIKKFLLENLGIRIIPKNAVDELREKNRGEVLDYSRKLTGWNNERREDRQKSFRRIDCEVDAFLLIVHWGNAKKYFEFAEMKECAYLSLGSSLPKLRDSLSEPSGIFSISPQAIWEILVRLESGSDVAPPDFRSLMMTSYFRLSDHFLDNSRYRSYFRPLIDRSRKGFQEHFETLESLLEMDLGSDLLDQYPEEDVPMVVQSLTAAASEKASLDRTRIVELSKKTDELNAMLEGYRNKEKKRQMYIKKQRAKRKKR